MTLETTPTEEEPATNPLGDFFSRFETASKSVTSELTSIWAEVEKALGDAIEPPQATLADPSDLGQLKTSRQSLRATYLEGPLKRLERSRPHRRILLALETFDRKVEETVRSLPQTVEGSWQDFATWLKLGRKASTKPRTVALRSTAIWVVQKESRLRTRQEDILVHSVSECLSLIRSVWQTVSLVHGQPQKELVTIEPLRLRWLQIKSAAKHSLTALDSQYAELRRSLPLRIWKHLGKKVPEKASIRPRHFEHWEAQIRSAEGELRLERAAEQAWDHIHGDLRQLARSIEGERADLVAELQRMADWLGLALENHDFKNVPATKARVVSAARRQEELHEGIDKAAGRLLSNLACLSRRPVSPPSRETWIQLYPEDSMKAAWVAISQESSEVFERCEGEHRKILQEVERARDVVRFALELEAESGSSSEPETSMVGKDALQNALDLLLYQLKEEPGRRFDVGAELRFVLPLLMCDYQWRTSGSRAGAVVHIVRQSLRRGGRSARRSLGLTASGAMRASLKYSAHQSREFLATIGFIHRERTVSSVHTRTYLPEQFVRKQERDLPAIYQRLYRIEPVEDARFLVGRSPETQAILEARQLWERGRSVAVLLSGQRGSGKTSLLNCIQNELHDLEVVRGEFAKRLTTKDQLDEFLRDLLDLETDADVKEALLERPRVLVIEELERTFIKTISGFEAIQALQNLIASTCHRTLWILAINQVAFKFLDRAVGLSQRFTHKIQTASASRRDLETAIMVRHNLSGLRLRFSSRHEAPSRLRGLQRRLTGAKDPREAFFEGLSRQSTGVYRTALEMWLAHIETVEAGVVYLQPIELPDLGPIVDELDPDDLFTLVGILQHGSLLPEEHCKIFACGQHKSNTQLDELISRELLENDPNHLGLRIRPEAMPVVKEALYRRNLL